MPGSGGTSNGAGEDSNARSQDAGGQTSLESEPDAGAAEPPRVDDESTGAIGDAGSMSGVEEDDSGTAQSEGCGNAPTLDDSPSTGMFIYNTLSSGGRERRYILRLPDDYDETHPYRLILGFHGATDSATNVAGNPAFFGLYERSEASTIFIAPEAVDGIWSDTDDVVLVDDILAEVKAQLCIDTTRVIVQGFSQGGAMARVLACARPGVFRAAVANSAGGLPVPASCEPIPFLGSLGLQESGGGGQAGQTDFFASAAGCTIETLPLAPSGGHVCSDYQGCSQGHPVRWCSYDAGHTPLPNDAGQTASWMPEEVWAFVSQF
jgi:poly(3-hydroxybutyrate) depolymerase